MRIQVPPHFFHVEGSALFLPWQFLIAIVIDTLLFANVGFFSSPWAFLSHYLPLLS